MHPTLSTDDLEHVLRQALPPEHNGRAGELAHALVAAASGDRRALADPALRSALRALGGTTVEAGGALLDFRGAQAGDITIGDVAGGDVIKISVTTAPLRLTPQERRNRQLMLQKVRAIWVDGLLRQLLAEVTRIELGLTERPNAVQLALSTQYQELGRPPRDLPAGAPIIDVFDAAGGALLILGAPGAGKTTMLLELCRDLLVRAVADDAYPIPVVFNLSSWAARRHPLNQWLVEELNAKYDVPRTIARAWIADGALAPLLDGLDEVADEDRAACVAACNAFKERYLVPLAICSRTGAYDFQGEKLRLQSGVVIQPLTLLQIEQYLAGGGQLHPELQVALREDDQLQEVMNTPLMLQVMVLTQQKLSPDTLSMQHTIEAKRRMLFDIYVQHMLHRRGIIREYSHQKTCRWLSWLARTLVQQAQTIFFIEQLQPEWLPFGSMRRSYVIIRAIASNSPW